MKEPGHVACRGLAHVAVGDVAAVKIRLGLLPLGDGRQVATGSVFQSWTVNARTYDFALPVARASLATQTTR